MDLVNGIKLYSLSCWGHQREPAACSLLQAIRGQLNDIATLRNTAAVDTSERQRLLEEIAAALAQLAALAGERDDMSCLRHTRASHICKVTAAQVQLQVQSAA